jgi:hypothetical protein
VALRVPHDLAQAFEHRMQCRVRDTRHGSRDRRGAGPCC